MSQTKPKIPSILHDSFADDVSLNNSIDVPGSPESKDDKTTQFEKMYKIFRKPKEEREEEDVDFIKGVLKTLYFFSQIKHDDLDFEEYLQHVYTAMNHKSFRKNEAVFHYGENGTNFYLILKGQVDVYVPKTPEELSQDLKQKVEFDLRSAPRVSIVHRRRGTSNSLANSTRLSIGNIDMSRRTSLFLDPKAFGALTERMPTLKKNFHSVQKIVKENSCVFERFTEKQDMYMKNGIPKFKKVRTLCPGELFGEHALSSETTRDATMVAVTNLQVVMVSKASYNSIFECLEKSLRLKWEFFAKLTGHASKEAVLKFCYGFRERTYKYGQVIFSQGQVPEEIFVIREGEVQIIKQEVHDEGQQRYRKSKKNIVEKKIVNVGPPNFFGEGEALLGQPYEHTAKSMSSHTVVYVLSIQEFQALKQEYSFIWDEVLAKHQTKMPYWKSRDSHISRIKEKLEEQQNAMLRTFSSNSNTSREETNNSQERLLTEENKSPLLDRRKSKFNLTLKGSGTRDLSVNSDSSKKNQIDTPVSQRQSTFNFKNILTELDSPRIDNDAKSIPSPLRRDSLSSLFGGRHITEIVESKFKVLKRQSIQNEAAETCPTEYDDSSPFSITRSPKKKSSLSPDSLASRVIQTQTDEIMMKKTSQSLALEPRKLKPYEVDLSKTKIKGLNIPVLPLKTETSVSIQSPKNQAIPSSTLLSPKYMKEKLPTLGDSPNYEYFLPYNKLHSSEGISPNMLSPQEQSRKGTIPTITDTFSPRGLTSLKLNPILTPKSFEPAMKTDLISYNIAEYELKSPFTSRRGALTLSINSLRTSDMVYGGAYLNQRVEAIVSPQQKLKKIQVGLKGIKGPVTHRINPIIPSQHNMFRVKPNRAHIISDFYKTESGNPNSKRSKK